MIDTKASEIATVGRVFQPISRRSIYRRSKIGYKFREISRTLPARHRRWQRTGPAGTNLCYRVMRHQSPSSAVEATISAACEGWILRLSRPFFPHADQCSFTNTDGPLVRSHLQSCSFYLGHDPPVNLHVSPDTRFTSNFSHLLGPGVSVGMSCQHPAISLWPVFHPA